MNYRLLNEVLIEWNESSKDDSNNTFLQSEDIKTSIQKLPTFKEFNKWFINLADIYEDVKMTLHDFYVKNKSVLKDIQLKDFDRSRWNGNIQIGPVFSFINKFYIYLNPTYGTTRYAAMTYYTEWYHMEPKYGIYKKFVADHDIKELYGDLCSEKLPYRNNCIFYFRAGEPGASNAMKSVYNKILNFEGFYNNFSEYIQKEYDQLKNKLYIKNINLTIEATYEDLLYYIAFSIPEDKSSREFGYVWDFLKISKWFYNEYRNYLKANIENILR